MILLVSSLSAQEYELKMYFNNTQGDKDSIIIGYDTNATYDIDSVFGESNILGRAYGEDLEVRASIYEYEDIRNEDTRIIESKKMIIGKVCEDTKYFDEANAIMIVIKNVAWPLSVSWNMDAIDEACKRTQLVNCTPGGWFDVCSGRGGNVLTWMPDTNSAEFADTDYRIIEENGDTLNAIFVSFSERLGSSVKSDNHYELNEVFPNPTTKTFTFKEKFATGSILEMYDSSGRLIYTQDANKTHEIEKHGQGVYFYQVVRGARILKRGKVVKSMTSL